MRHLIGNCDKPYCPIDHLCPDCLSLSEDVYACSICQGQWQFAPEDYDDIADFPEVCPLCEMPITQMIHDVYKEEGVLEVLRMLWLRLKNNLFI